MKIRIIVFLFVIGLVNSAHANGNQSTTQPQYCHAIVQDNKAAFVFPIMDADELTWFNKETKDNDLEYSWEVILPGEKQSLKFGAFLFKYPGEKVKAGSLKELIKDAQWTVFDQQLTPNGGTTSKMLDDMKVTVKIVDGGVVVGITDKATFDKAFTNHPEKAQFVIRTPSDPPFPCDASIEYRGK